jgi:glycosyltransferase involved in cell wall biosynthesis
VSPRVELAHHWLTGMRGGEKVLEQLALLFPERICHTLVAQPERLSAPLRSLKIRPSLLHYLPGGPRHYRTLLPLFPAAIRGMRVGRKADLVFSSDAALIKGLRVPEGVPHICYCHSPPRYLWDMHETYLQSSHLNWLGRRIFSAAVPALQLFDRESAQRVTAFIANSWFVQDRILNLYGRDSFVIHPPVSIDEFKIREEGPDDFYLIVSQLVPYKRIDLAVAAFNAMKKKLVIIGEGSEGAALRAQAGPTITFLGAQRDEVLQDHYARCLALIFPGIEDFGITPLEAQASGRPVIAFRAGGVLETVLEKHTGLFFDRQESASLADAVDRFEQMYKVFDPQECRAQAEKFRPERFQHEIKAFLEISLPDLFRDYAWPV